MINVFIIGGVSVLGWLALVGWRRYDRGRRVAAAEKAIDLQRAHTIIGELESISQQVRRSLAAHQGSILRFKQRVDSLSHTDESSVREISTEAEKVLEPTEMLARQIAAAYEQIRRQSSLLNLMSSATRDPLTHVENRPTLENALLRIFEAGDGMDFCLAIFDLDNFRHFNMTHGPQQGDLVLRQLASILRHGTRSGDLVARYENDDFIVLMPVTDLREACLRCAELRGAVAAKLPLTVSCGIAVVEASDSQERLLARADAALYSARSGGGNVIFAHAGRHIELVDDSGRLASELNDAEFEALGAAGETRAFVLA